MKFAHFSDVHIGGWREEALRRINVDAFDRGIEICIDENVGFVIIAGDLFDTPLPSIDLIKDVAAILNKLKEADIDVYVVPGSHDQSPSGKTMLDVLEKAGLLHNVFKYKDGELEFTVDKTGVKLTGILGQKGGLEKYKLRELNREKLEKEKGFKIFLFHTMLNEFKPEGLEIVEAESYKLMPRNFDYYAGGHPHFVFDKKVEDYGLITYPGALFPNNFKEIEKFKHGGFYICDDKLNLKWIPVKIKDVECFKFNANNKNPLDIEMEMIETLAKKDLKNKIVTLRVEGVLNSGKTSDINFNKVFEAANEACFVMKNTYKLTTKELQEVQVQEGSVDEIEESVVKEHLGQFNGMTSEREKQLVELLIPAFDKEKDEGEVKAVFEERIITDVFNILGIEDEIK
ncbi:MAG: DNA repair exonuclease [Candidatus Nanoarchaeia archaeon]|nr:DNA repair exonuclease [Candidatus Nanoarchaeia archaeon]